jgi:hypothetical protein
MTGLSFMRWEDRMKSAFLAVPDVTKGWQCVWMVVVTLSSLIGQANGDDVAFASLSPELRSQIETHLSWEPRLWPPDEDAAPLLIEAVRKRHAIDDRELTERLWQALDGRTGWLDGDDLATCRDLVFRNREAFDLLARAAARQGISDRKHPGLNATALRELFTLAQFAAHERAARGDWDAAIEPMALFLRAVHPCGNRGND